MKCYFAISELSVSDPSYLDLLRVGISTCLLNTSLKPHLLWDGGESEFIITLRKLGVEIIPCSTRFLSLVNKRWTDEGHRKIALGAFMRLEIPEIEKSDEYVLYTDCDVIFASNPRLDSFKPRFFSVAPEFDFGDYRELNSGVMVINTRGMRAVQADFDAYVRNNFDSFKLWDQDALKWFFHDKFDYLPPTLNWKSFWGSARSVEILHFQLKPYHIREFANNRIDDQIRPVLWLYERNPAFCRSMLKLWDLYLEQARAVFRNQSIDVSTLHNWPSDFDGLFYLMQNLDVLEANLDPFDHYSNYGKSEGRAYPIQHRRES